jgi:hypothetical protein
LLEQMVENGVNLELVAVTANTAKVLEAIERLETGPRGRAESRPSQIIRERTATLLQRREKRPVRALGEEPRGRIAVHRSVNWHFVPCERGQPSRAPET